MSKCNRPVGRHTTKNGCRNKNKGYFPTHCLSSKITIDSYGAQKKKKPLSNKALKAKDNILKAG